MTLGGGWQRGNGGGYENDYGRKLRGRVKSHGGDEEADLNACPQPIEEFAGMNPQTLLPGGNLYVCNSTFASDPGVNLL